MEDASTLDQQIVQYTTAAYGITDRKVFASDSWLNRYEQLKIIGGDSTVEIFSCYLLLENVID